MEVFACLIVMFSLFQPHVKGHRKRKLNWNFRRCRKNGRRIVFWRRRRRRTSSGWKISTSTSIPCRSTMTFPKSAGQSSTHISVEFRWPIFYTAYLLSPTQSFFSEFQCASCVFFVVVNGLIRWLGYLKRNCFLQCPSHFSQRKTNESFFCGFFFKRKLKTLNKQLAGLSEWLSQEITVLVNVFCLFRNESIFFFSQLRFHQWTGPGDTWEWCRMQCQMPEWKAFWNLHWCLFVRPPQRRPSFPGEYSRRRCRKTCRWSRQKSRRSHRPVRLK